MKEALQTPVAVCSLVFEPSQKMGVWAGYWSRMSAKQACHASGGRSGFFEVCRVRSIIGIFIGKIVWGVSTGTEENVRFWEMNSWCMRPVVGRGLLCSW